jgi:exonuclease III
MKFLSFNAMGLCSNPKILALKWIIRDNGLDVIFIQETMVLGRRSREVMEPSLKGWSFGTMDTDGNLGGILMD